MRSRAILITACLGGLCGVLRAEEVLIAMTYLGLEKPTPFPAQLLLQVTNDSFTSVSLQDKLQTSQLFVDGQAFSRRDVPFPGPPGLSPKRAWNGCLRLDDYIPEGLTPGHHELQLKIGDHVSKKIRVTSAGTAPAAEKPPERRQQVDTLAGLITPGLLRACVENWFTEQDGGLQTSAQTRYYVDPGVKVLVTYEESPAGSRVKGRLRMYTESRVLD